MTSTYDYIKKWRKKAKNKKYAATYMKKRRAYYREAYLRGDVKYDDIPKAYRYFVDTQKI